MHVVKTGRSRKTKEWEPFVKASTVRITKADGSVEYEKALNRKDLAKAKTRKKNPGKGSPNSIGRNS